MWLSGSSLELHVYLGGLMLLLNIPWKLKTPELVSAGQLDLPLAVGLVLYSLWALPVLGCFPNTQLRSLLDCGQSLYGYLEL